MGGLTLAHHIAVDGHDRTLYVLGVDPVPGEERLRRRFPHTEAGVTELTARLAPGDTVVMEATRGAHSLAHRRDRTGATVLMADPQRCRLLGFRGKKTDDRDGLALLSLLRGGALPTLWRPDPRTRARRPLSRERHAVHHQGTQFKNRRIALLREEGLFAPEGDRLFGSEGDAWLAALALPAHTLAVWRRTGRRLQGSEAAKQCQDRAFAACALTDPRAWRLLQIPGFGPTAVRLVLGEVGDFARFRESRHLASYAGLDPQGEQSGDDRGTGPIRRAGRRPLRWIMGEVAWGHVLAKGPEADRYHRLLRKGKPPAVAIVALARHLRVLAPLRLASDAPAGGSKLP